MAALAGAVAIAVQVPAMHWFYFYIPWFMPFALVALMGAFRGEADQLEPEWPAVALAAEGDSRGAEHRVTT